MLISNSHKRVLRGRAHATADLLAGLLATTTASAVRAQQSSKIRRVAVFYPGTLGDPEHEVFGAFLTELGCRGYIEGKNLVIDLGEAHGLLERIPPLMDELVALRPDLIVAVGNPVVAAAQRATATIPIVMWSVLDPVRFGFISSLARPAGNTTGTTAVADVYVSKAVELLHLLVPAAHRVAVLLSSDPGQQLLFELVKKVAEAMGLIVVPISAPTPADLDHAFAEMVAKQCEALFVPIQAAHNGPAIPLLAARSRNCPPSISYAISWKMEGSRAMARTICRLRDGQLI